MYEGLESMIMERREDNLMYGEYFEWLYKKVKRRTSQFSVCEPKRVLGIQKRKMTCKKHIEKKTSQKEK